MRNLDFVISREIKMYSYEPLRTYLKLNNISWYKFQKLTHLPNTTVRRFQKDLPTEITTLTNVCLALDLNIEDVVVINKSEPIAET